MLIHRSIGKLDLDTEHMAPLFDHEIDLTALLRAPEIETAAWRQHVYLYSQMQVDQRLEEVAVIATLAQGTLTGLTATALRRAGVSHRG